MSRRFVGTGVFCVAIIVTTFCYCIWIGVFIGQHRSHSLLVQRMFEMVEVGSVMRFGFLVMLEIIFVLLEK